MKKTFALVFFAIISLSSFAQENLKTKLNEVFSEKKTSSILGDAQKKEYYNNIFFNSFEIQQVEANKFSQLNYSSLSQVTLKDKSKAETIINGSELVALIKQGNFNILLSNLERDFNNRTYYKIEGTNYILILYSHKELK